MNIFIRLCEEEPLIRIYKVFVATVVIVAFGLVSYWFYSSYRAEVRFRFQKSKLVNGLVNRVDSIDLGSGWYYFTPNGGAEMLRVSTIGKRPSSNSWDIVTFVSLDCRKDFVEKLNKDFLRVMLDVGLTNGYLVMMRTPVKTVHNSKDL